MLNKSTKSFKRIKYILLKMGKIVWRLKNNVQFII